MRSIHIKAERSWYSYLSFERGEKTFHEYRSGEKSYECRPMTDEVPLRFSAARIRGARRAVVAHLDLFEQRRFRSFRVTSRHGWPSTTCT